MRAIKFLHFNIAYILWFIFYFGFAWAILGGNLISFILVSIIYGISITIALCPIGEVILRVLENCRELATEQERNYLMPMFEEVYQNAKEVNPKLNNGVQLYIMDAMYVNAFAMGRKTIAVTRGAIEAFTADELRGIMAHELGHITHGHTKALLLSVIGNFYFSIIVWIFRLLFFIAQVIADITAQFNFVGTFFSLFTLMIRFFMDMTVIMFINASQLILAINSRSNEIQADRFAFEIGYGRELISGMYLLQKITMNTKLKLSEKLKASHPHMADRIAHLEKLENQLVEE